MSLDTILASLSWPDVDDPKTAAKRAVAYLTSRQLSSAYAEDAKRLAADWVETHRDLNGEYYCRVLADVINTCASLAIDSAVLFEVLRTGLHPTQLAFALNTEPVDKSTYLQEIRDYCRTHLAKGPTGITEDLSSPGSGLLLIDALDSTRQSLQELRIRYTLPPSVLIEVARLEVARGGKSEWAVRTTLALLLELVIDAGATIDREGAADAKSTPTKRAGNAELYAARVESLLNTIKWLRAKGTTEAGTHQIETFYNHLYEFLTLSTTDETLRALREEHFDVCLENIQAYADLATTQRLDYWPVDVELSGHHVLRDLCQSTDHHDICAAIHKSTGWEPWCHAASPKHYERLLNTVDSLKRNQRELYLALLPNTDSDPQELAAATRALIPG